MFVLGYIAIWQNILYRLEKLYIILKSRIISNYNKKLFLECK